MNFFPRVPSKSEKPFSSMGEINPYFAPELPGKQISMVLPPPSSVKPFPLSQLASLSPFIFAHLSRKVPSVLRPLFSLRKCPFFGLAPRLFSPTILVIECFLSCTLPLPSFGRSPRWASPSGGGFDSFNCSCLSSHRFQHSSDASGPFQVA